MIDPRPSSGGDDSGMIVGVVIALLLFVIILIVTLAVLAWMICRYRKNGKLDTCDAFSCGLCLSTCARLKNIKIPLKQRQNLNRNGLSEQRYRADHIEVEVYSSVQKPPKKVESPPPLPPQTLTEMELNDIMNPMDTDASPTHKNLLQHNTELFTYSQSESSPKLAKVTKLKKFKMKDNPIYQSTDELIPENDSHDNPDTVIYALPSKASVSLNNTNNSHIDETTSEPIYSEAIDPTMFTRRESKVTSDDDLHPYGPIYAKPVKPVQNMRQPLEVGEENIREVKQIGVGQFGAVILAEMTVKSPKAGVGKDEPTLVAVKRLKADVSNEIRTSFDKEIKFMSQLEHENIVQLLAVCNQKANPFIVMEYMENGDLNQYLQKFQLAEDDVTVYANQIPSSVLLYMAIQIASGMGYLASLKYVHRDLAIRNCLVGSNFCIKISDFGMSRKLYERVYYRVRGRAMLPIRWMATESFYGRFSEKSDIWAYGVSVWEIFTLGKKQPYEELDDQEMIQDAIKGTGRRIMNKPKGCPQAVYEVLLHCWEYAAEDRATFKEVHDGLLTIQQNS